MKKTGVKIPVYGARALRDVYAKCHVSRLVKNYQPKSFKSSITWFEKSPIRFTSLDRLAKSLVCPFLYTFLFCQLLVCAWFWDFVALSQHSTTQYPFAALCATVRRCFLRLVFAIGYNDVFLQYAS